MIPSFYFNMTLHSSIILYFLLQFWKLVIIKKKKTLSGKSSLESVYELLILNYWSLFLHILMDKIRKYICVYYYINLNNTWNSSKNLGFFKNLLFILYFHLFYLKVKILVPNNIITMNYLLHPIGIYMYVLSIVSEENISKTLITLNQISLFSLFFRVFWSLEKYLTRKML